MSGFGILITDAGRAALVATGGTNAVQITEFGYTATGFVVSPTMTALPGELGRVDTIAGAAVNDTTIHVTVRDSTSAAYVMRGFAFYLDDGTLFAVYGQGTPIMEKAAASVLLAAFDIAVLDGDAELIEFGTANFSYPPATETVKGVAELATQGEVNTGTDHQRIVTPLTLAQRLAAFLASIMTTIADYIPLAQKGAANGVATLDGGGKIPSAQLPPIAISDTFVVSSQAAMLALTAERGDTCVRTDLQKTYILQSEPATTLANWIELLNPAAPVQSVNGFTGTVSLGPGDIGAAPSLRTISTTGLATGGGNLTAERTIDVPAASAAEADAGTVTTKALTPASLANILTNIASKAASARQVLTSGLATGGGNLTADRTIDVPGATAAEIQAGAAGDKAVTPAALRAAYTYVDGPEGTRTSPDGWTIKWGRFTAGANTITNHVFDDSFLNACHVVVVSGVGGLGVDSKDNPPAVYGTPTASSFDVFSADDTSAPTNFIAIGD